MEKRYLLIAGELYYPCRGTGDWIARFDTREEAQKCIVERTFNAAGVCNYLDVVIDGKFSFSADWYEIIDLETFGL